MNPLTNLLIWIGNHFTTTAYMASTKIQGLVWSTADILLIFILLKIAGHIRELTGRKPITWRYYLLWITAVLTPAILFAKSPNQILVFESIICGTQFAVLVFTVVRERAAMVAFLKRVR